MLLDIMHVFVGYSKMVFILGKLLRFCPGLIFVERKPVAYVAAHSDVSWGVAEEAISTLQSETGCHHTCWHLFCSGSLARSLYPMIWFLHIIFR